MSNRLHIYIKPIIDKKSWAIFVLVLGTAFPGLAQLDTNSKTQYDTLLMLPWLPIQKDIIDTALVYSPLLKYYNDKLKQSEYEFLASRYDWLDQSYIDSEVKYGQYGASNPLSQLSLGYSTGAKLSIPLTAIFGNKNRRKVYAMEVEAAIHKKAEAEAELRRIIIRQYNKVLLKQEIVQIKSVSSQSTLMHLNMAEREFNEGIIPVSELARVTEIYTRELEEFTIIKSEFNTEYVILEELVGKSFRHQNW